MFPEHLRPKKLYDLIDHVDDYLNIMRERNETEEVSKKLKDYTWGYLRNVPLNKEELQVIGAVFSDLIYQYANSTKSIDVLIRYYFATVIGDLYDRLRDRGIDVFYMLDNDFTTCEHRFQLTAILFEAAGFAVVSPHKLWHGFSKIETIEERHERLLLDMPTLSSDSTDSRIMAYDQIEKILLHNMSIPVGILYVEKNTAVDYLVQVKQLALPSDYTTIYRHEGCESKNFELYK